MRKADRVYSRMPCAWEVMSPSDSVIYDEGGRKSFDAAQRLFHKAGNTSYRMFLVLAADLAVRGDRDGLIDIANGTKMDLGKGRAGFRNADALLKNLHDLERWILNPEAVAFMKGVILLYTTNMDPQPTAPGFITGPT